MSSAVQPGVSPGKKGGVPDGWQRISDYCIQRGKWTIAKVYVNGWIYELWPGQKPFDSAAKAAKEVERIEAGFGRGQGFSAGSAVEARTARASK